MIWYKKESCLFSPPAVCPPSVGDENERRSPRINDEAVRPLTELDASSFFFFLLFCSLLVRLLCCWLFSSLPFLTLLACVLLLFRRVCVCCFPLHLVAMTTATTPLEILLASPPPTHLPSYTSLLCVSLDLSKRQRRKRKGEKKWLRITKTKKCLLLLLLAGRKRPSIHPPPILDDYVIIAKWITLHR